MSCYATYAHAPEDIVQDLSCRLLDSYQQFRARYVLRTSFGLGRGGVELTKSRFRQCGGSPLTPILITGPQCAVQLERIARRGSGGHLVVVEGRARGSPSRKPVMILVTSFRLRVNIIKQFRHPQSNFCRRFHGIPTKTPTLYNSY